MKFSPFILTLALTISINSAAKADLLSEADMAAFCKKLNVNYSDIALAKYVDQLKNDRSVNFKFIDDSQVLLLEAHALQLVEMAMHLENAFYRSKKITEVGRTDFVDLVNAQYLRAELLKKHKVGATRSEDFVKLVSIAERNFQIYNSLLHHN